VNAASPGLAWSEALSVGDALIDGEHRVFLDLVNAITQAVENKSPRDEILRLLDRFLKEAAAHFQHEEELLEGRGWPGLAQHRKAHQGALTAFGREALALSALADGSPEWFERVLTIKTILVDHLLKQDMQFKSFLLDCKGL
jgi:hemerythrin